jgi:hypothetical protein
LQNDVSVGIRSKSERSLRLRSIWLALAQSGHLRCVRARAARVCTHHLCWVPHGRELRMPNCLGTVGIGSSFCACLVRPSLGTHCECRVRAHMVEGAMVKTGNQHAKSQQLLPQDQRDRQRLPKAPASSLLGKYTLRDTRSSKDTSTYRGLCPPPTARRIRWDA